LASTAPFVALLSLHDNPLLFSDYHANLIFEALQTVILSIGVEDQVAIEVLLRQVFRKQL